MVLATSFIPILILEAIPLRNSSLPTAMLSVQTPSRINRGAMETVSPEGAAAVLAEIIVLSKLSLQFLHEAAEVPQTITHPKGVNMITGDTRAKESNPVFADSIPQAGAILDSVESEAQ
jgi:hypothetical protein